MNRRIIAFRRYRRRFVRPLWTAHGEWAVREGWIVRVEADGLVGYGEVAPIPDFGTETIDEAEAFLRRLSEDPSIPVPAELPCCAFALSAAAPRGDPAPERVYPVAALLPAGDAAVDALERKLRDGFACFKWKIGVSGWDRERRVLEQLMQILPAEGKLRLDANAGLSLRRTEQWLERLAEYGGRIEFLEQAMAVGEEATMARLAGDSGVPVALDESLNGPDAARWLVPGAWSGPLVVKPALMGDRARQVSLLRPLASQVVYSSAFETGIGAAQVLRLADALPASDYALGFDTAEAFQDAMNPLKSSGGLTPEARRAINPAEIWKQLPHSN